MVKKNKIITLLRRAQINTNNSVSSRLECSARESYRERTKFIQHDETLTPELREGLDYDPICQKRRIPATITTMAESKKRAQHLCTDVPGV